jgi:hypothetical protein
MSVRPPAAAPTWSPDLRVRVLDDPLVPVDAREVEAFEAGIRDVDLAAPAVVLPDFHHKDDMEMPSSIAVATTDTLRPTLTSASLNCGMALVALDTDRPSDAAVERFYRGLRTRYPFPPRYRRELSPADVVRAATDGARFAADRFGATDRDLERMEEGGRLDVEPFGGAARVRRELPGAVTFLSRLRFGTVGPSNHFVELQEVAELLDPDVARVLGVSSGQVTLQYHAGGGVLPGQLGALFGRRRHFPLPHRVEMAVQKPLYHVARARSRAEVLDRIRLYLSRGCPPVPRWGPEGERLRLANAMAMNYGFAFRLATYQTMGRLGRQAFGSDAFELVVDSPHNSMYEEDVAGAPAVVHRHNACRARPPSRMGGHPVFGLTGQPVLLPGTHRTSSYLCVADEGAAEALDSASHGAGATIAELVRRGRSEALPDGPRTLEFGYDGRPPRPVRHFDDRGIAACLRILVEHRVVRPVARLRPFAVLH